MSPFLSCPPPPFCFPKHFFQPLNKVQDTVMDKIDKTSFLWRSHFSGLMDTIIKEITTKQKISEQLLIHLVQTIKIIS